MPQNLFNWYDIEKLLSTSTLSQEDKEYYQGRLFELEESENEFAFDEIKEIIRLLYNHQADPIIMGWNYGAKDDIIRHLKKLK